MGQLQLKLTMLSVVAAVLIGGATFWIMRRMMAPLKTLARTVAAVADGETDLVVGGTRAGDEIGSMARSVQVFKDAAVEKARLELEAEGVRAAAATSRERLAAIENAKAEDLRAFVQGVEASFERLAG